MSMGVRVGVVPTSSGGSSAGRRRASTSSGYAAMGNGDADSDSDYEADGDGDSRDKGPHGPSKASNSLRSTATATSNFLQIPVKNSELKEKLRGIGTANRSNSIALGAGAGAGAGAATGGAVPGARSSFVLPSQRRKQEQRDRRRSSVLQSLAMLDVNDDDEDDLEQSFRSHGGTSGDNGRHSEPNEKAHAGAPLLPSEPKGRYLRRGSVTKHQLLPNVDAMQPSVHTPRAAASPLHPTNPSHSDIPRRADFDQDETDFSNTGYTSDSYGYASDASMSSNAHVAANQRRRQSSAAVLGSSTGPPLTSQNAQLHNRNLRRGSVTRPNDKDDDSVASMPPLSSSASSSKSIDALPPRQKYNRRGSVTKFSLDSYLQNPTNAKGLQGDGKQAASNVDYGYNDDNDNGSVVSMPPLSSSAFSSKSTDALPPRQKYKRRGSVTKFSLDSYLQNPTSAKGLQGDVKQAPSTVDYGYNDDNDNGSVVSMPPLSTSAAKSKDVLPPRQKYNRRGSVTKFSLDSYLQNPTHTKGLQGDGKQAPSTVDYGYNDDTDNGSVVSMPPLSSSASFPQSTDSLPARQKYKRRGSVTKFSLDPSNANQNNTAALQPSPEKITNHVVPSPNAPLAARSNHNDSDSDSDDSDNETRPKPKPGDDDYSENLENSGRFSRRSISISADADDTQPSTFTDSKRPPLPRAHSASSAIQGIKPKKKLAAPKDAKSDAGLERNHIKIRMTNGEQQTPSRPTNTLKSALEDDSGHIKKSWYSQTPVTRRDSMSSLDSENSDVEFGSEGADSQRKQRSPPRLPPHAPKTSRANEMTTIDGNSLTSSSFDDMTSISGISEDEGADTPPTRKKPLRARRSSIVGIPSASDSGYASLDDGSSHVEPDEGAPTPTPSKMRARRGSIVGIPTIEPASPPSNPPSTEDDTEKILNTKAALSGDQEPAKSKKKGTTKAKSSTKVKKSGVSDSSPSNATSTTSERRGCLKAADASGMPKKVRFGHLVITEFPIILGDNPAVTSGAPVTIDWTPQKETRLSINAYEQCKPRRRRRRKLLISVSNRAILLLAAGYSIDEIADASIDAQQIKLGRQQTLDNQSWDRINHMLETTGDAIGGIFLQPLQITGKKLKSLVVKPQQHSASARMA